MVKFLRTWWRLLIAVAFLAAAIQFFVRPGGVFPNPLLGEIGASLFRPVYESVDFLRRGISSVWSGYISLLHVERENAALRDEVAALKERLAESRDAVLENRRLEELLRFSKTMETRTVGARVVGHDVSPWFQGIFIAGGLRRGSRWGWRWSLPPAQSDASTGPTRSFGSHPPDGQPLCRDVIVERTRARAIAEGMGGNLCRLKYVSPTEDVVRGTGSSFPGSTGACRRGPFWAPS